MAPLAESKASLDAEMAKLLTALAGNCEGGRISGGDWPQFEKQVLSNLPHDEHLKNCPSFPPCGQSSTNTRVIGKNLLGRFHRGRKKENHQFAKQAVGSAASRSKTWGEPN